MEGRIPAGELLLCPLDSTGADRQPPARRPFPASGSGRHRGIHQGSVLSLVSRLNVRGEQRWTRASHRRRAGSRGRLGPLYPPSSAAPRPNPQPPSSHSSLPPCLPSSKLSPSPRIPPTARARASPSLSGRCHRRSTRPQPSRRSRRARSPAPAASSAPRAGRTRTPSSRSVLLCSRYLVRGPVADDRPLPRRSAILCAPSEWSTSPPPPLWHTCWSRADVVTSPCSTFWINPAGVSLACMNVSTLVQIDIEGNIVAGPSDAVCASCALSPFPLVQPES